MERQINCKNAMPRGMSRRAALRASLLGATALALPAVAGCRRTPSLALAPWSGPPPDSSDPRLVALSYASLAPNAHNTQPWLVSLGKDSIDLFVDGSRLLPETDPPFRQTHVSQGTFLELLVIALAEHATSSTVEYFPEGEYANDVLEPRPVARVHLGTGGATRDPLFASITERRSNKSIYDANHALTDAETHALSAATQDPAATVAVISDEASRARLAAICTDAMAAEVRAPRRNAETAHWFRFSEAEVERSRDGFGMAQTGRGKAAQWFAERFVLDREHAADPSGPFATGAVDTTREQASSAAAFGVLSTDGNARKAQIVAGRAYARVALTATSLGLAMHPMSQALEEYPDMSAVKARLEREVGLASGRTVQMFFRLGHAAPTEHTPRRDVHSLIKPA
jgi:hypothetical protein